MKRTRRGVGALAVFAIVTAALVVAGASLMFAFSFPFGTHTTDHSAPPLLTQLENLSRYQGAQANFETIVDVSHDVDHVPDFVAGERSQLKASGNVPAYVDFGGLTKGDITVDGKDVTVRLPHAQLGDVAIDQQHTEVINHDRGLMNRIGEFFGDGPGDDSAALYRKASEKMAAAAANSDVQLRAEENTRLMLTGMLNALGYRNVTVVFTDPPQ